MTIDRPWAREADVVDDMEDEATRAASLIGPVAGHLGGAVLDPELSALLDRLDAVEALMDDATPLPSTRSRHGRFDDRHLEFWLSGHLDARKAVDALGLTRESEAVIVDVDGWAGRIVRHLTRELPRADVYLRERTSAGAALMRRTLGDRVTAFTAGPRSPMPLADASVDAVLAFDVLDGLDDEFEFLLELRRVVRPGGAVYATLYDETTWSELPRWYLGERLLADPVFRAYRDGHPELSGPVRYAGAGTGGSPVVFRPRSYIDAAWSRLFTIEAVKPLAHAESASILLRA